jgi:uncharacterized protein YndB with AHSA1/START domain
MAADPVTASVHIDAPPERVYEYFTRPEAIVSWMGEYALLEAEPGGRFALDIKGAPVRGRFLELDPPRRLLISWGYAGSDHLPPGASTVEIRLTADRGGTRVELQHRDLPPPADTPAPIPACHRPRWRKAHRNARSGIVTGNTAASTPGADDNSARTRHSAHRARCEPASHRWFRIGIILRSAVRRLRASRDAVSSQAGPPRRDWRDLRRS